MKERDEEGSKRRFRLVKSVRKAKWDDAPSWNDNQMCIFLSFAKSGFINADSRSILCLHSPALPPAPHAALPPSLGATFVCRVTCQGLSRESCSELLSAYFEHSHSPSVPASLCCASEGESGGRRAECLRSRGGKKASLRRGG